MLSSVTRLITSTVRIWFLRQARAMRCSSFAGFHGRSRLITALAVCRLSPTLPLSVDRNSRHSGSCLKRAISARRRSCGTEPVCQATSSPQILRHLAHQGQHALPFREHDHLAVRIGEQFGQHPLELLQLRADAAGGIEDERRVAQHPHAGEQPLQPLELLLRQRPPLGDRATSRAACPLNSS